MAADTKTMKRFCAQISSPILLVHLRNHKVIFANEAAERLLGYSDAELFSKKVDSLFDSKFTQRIRAVFDLINDRTTKNLIIRESLVELVRKSGRRSQVNMCFSCQKNLLLINIEDMSDLIRLQREKEKLKEEAHRISKMADIGRLAGGIAHELNNPLGTILGYVENIEYVIEEGTATPENIKENLEPIHLSVLRMGRVIAKLMAMFRQETSQRHAVSVQKIVEEVALLLEDSLESHSITLKRNIHDLWVKADADQLIQVLINICNNAINALEDTKTERTIGIETSVADGKLTLNVANNGVEIPKSIQDKLFTPFFTTKDVGEGTGLGLYLCYNILKSHGGEITFSSSPTETRFSLHLPVMAAMDVPKPADEKLILVVEDDTFFRKVLAQKLAYCRSISNYGLWHLRRVKCMRLSLSQSQQCITMKLWQGLGL